VTAANGDSKPTQLARVANGVSALMAKLYAVYHPAIPADVRELDYLGREVQLDVTDGDLDQGKTDVNRVAALWKTLPSKVVNARWQERNGRFDDSVSAEREATTAMDSSAPESAAKTQLDRVDGLNACSRRRATRRNDGLVQSR
jgi:hypothetical protein